MHIKPFFLGLFYIWLIRCIQIYRFDALGMEKGAFLPYPKDKHGVEQIGEDSFTTSPNLLVVCDGVGGSYFSSKYISGLIATEYQRAISEIFKKNSRSHFESSKSFEIYTRMKIDKIMESYVALTENYIKSWEALRQKSSPLKPNHLGASTTFVAVLYGETNNKKIYRIVQKGDSLAVVFRLKKIEGTERFAYYPVYITKDMQYSFNFPHQFNTEFIEKDEDIFSQLIEAKAYDIVVLGSDGLFDNVHLSFLTMVINSVLAAGLLRDSDFPRMLEFTQSLIDVYVEVLHRKEWVIRKHFQEGQDYTIQEENNNSTPPANPIKKKGIKGFFKFFGKKKANEMPAGAPNFFQIELNSLFSETKPSNVVEKYQKSAFSHFLNCPVIELLTHSDKSEENEDLLSPCVKAVLEKHFSFEAETVRSFIKMYDASKTANFIATIAKRLSQENEGYPSPFYIHAWKSKVKGFSEASGKVDDITVVAGLLNLIEKDDLLDFNDKVGEELLNESRRIAGRMKRDVFSFLDYFSDMERRKNEAFQSLVTENDTPVDSSSKINEVDQSVVSQVVDENENDVDHPISEQKNIEDNNQEVVDLDAQIDSPIEEGWDQASDKVQADLRQTPQSPVAKQKNLYTHIIQDYLDDSNIDWDSLESNLDLSNPEDEDLLSMQIDQENGLLDIPLERDYKNEKPIYLDNEDFGNETHENTTSEKGILI